MSKVELSLQEYNDLRDELMLYKEIVDHLTTPEISDWDLEYAKSHKDYTIPVGCSRPKMFRRGETLFKALVEVKTQEVMEQYSIKGEIQFDTEYLMTNLCRIKIARSNEESEDLGDEEF